MKKVKLDELLMKLIIVGALLLSTGIGISIINPKGLALILAVAGTIISLLSSISLVILWVLKSL